MQTTHGNAVNGDDRQVHSSTTGHVIELQHVSKSYRHFHALRDVSLLFPSGITGLLGPNGAGKSTLIKILLGLLKASSGQATVLGCDVWRDSRRIRQLVGYMPEDDCYLPGLPGVECVQFAARLSGMPALGALRRAHEILDFCGAGQERYRTVETYSTGMRQKLKFAQALVHDPALLVLDEPTAGLDPDEREAMLSRIRSLATAHGKSIVICTHILPDVQQISDHVVILAGGRVSVSKSLVELSKPTVPALNVLTLGPNDRLCRALRERRLIVREGPFEAIVVEGDADETVRAIWRAAAESECLVRSLSPARNSMETIFLEAVQNSAREALDADS